MKIVALPKSSGKKIPLKTSKPTVKSKKEVSEEFDIEPEKPVKKKVLPKPDVPALPKPSSEIVDEKTELVLKSKFGEKSDVIIQMLEYGEDDGAITLILRNLMQTLVSIIPVVESNVVTSKGTKGIHGFNMTVSQMRELVADIQAVRDKGMLGQHIVERHVRPAFMDIAVQIVTGLSRIESNGRTRMSTEDFKVYSKELIEIKTSLANYIQTQYKEVSDSVIRSLS